MSDYTKICGYTQSPQIPYNNQTIQYMNTMPYYGNNYGYYTPNFKSGKTDNSPSDTTQLDKNTVEISPKEEIKKKQGMSKGAKWAIGISVGFAAILASLAVHKKIKTSQLKDSSVIKNLGEHIDFKEATNLEEALKFTKEKLSITEIDKDFTLDALNYVNKNIVTVSNKNKGKIYLPNKLSFKEDVEGSLASLNFASKNKDELVINKNYFDDNFLTTKLKELEPNLLEHNWNKEYVDLVNKFKQNPESLSITEKRNLFYTNTHRFYQDGPVLKLEDSGNSIQNEMTRLQDIQQLSKSLNVNNGNGWESFWEFLLDLLCVF